MDKLKIFRGTPSEVERDYNNWMKLQDSRTRTTTQLKTVATGIIVLAIWYRESK